MAAKGDVTVVNNNGELITFTDIHSIYVLSTPENRPSFLKIVRDGPGRILYLRDGSFSSIVAETKNAVGQRI